MQELTLAIAFIAGLVSFLSPCVLPIIPGFLAYLSGTSIGDSKANRSEIFINSLLFVLGFSLIFAILGVLLNSLLRSVAGDVLVWLGRVGGIIIIFFGLYLTKLIRIPYLEREHKLKVKTKFKSKYLTSFAFGSAFAAGWTPCVGAALGATLALAASQPVTAFSLLLSYSLGLGIPFLIVGLFTAQASNLINKYANVLSYVNIVFGIILIALGILVFTQNLNLVANFELLNQYLIN